MKAGVKTVPWVELEGGPSFDSRGENGTVKKPQEKAIEY